MRLHDGGILIVVGIVAFAIGIGCISTLFLEDDNPVEEFCEEIILDQTKIDIDLSPNSPEM